MSSTSDPSMGAETRAGISDNPFDRGNDQPCVVCTQMDQTLFDLMSKWQAGLSTDRILQEEHARRGGFCPRHSWSYEAIASPHGICLAYPAVLAEYAKRLRSFVRETVGMETLVSGLKKILSQSNSCAACDRVAETEKAAVDNVVSKMVEHGQEGAAAPSLCLPHLCTILEAGVDPKPAQALVQAMSQDFERLAVAMQAFASKFAARRRQDITREEKDAYKRGLSRLVGERNISAPWNMG